MKATSGSLVAALVALLFAAISNALPLNRSQRFASPSGQLGGKISHVAPAHRQEGSIVERPTIGVRGGSFTAKRAIVFSSGAVLIRLFSSFLNKLQQRGVQDSGPTTKAKMASALSLIGSSIIVVAVSTLVIGRDDQFFLLDAAGLFVTAIGFALLNEDQEHSAILATGALGLGGILGVLFALSY